MSATPADGLRVPPAALQQFIAELFSRAGTTAEDASALAELLVLTDLRGVLTHGTRRAPDYLAGLRSGWINPRPRITVVRDTPTTAVLDGDGGLGHLPALRAAQLATEKARALGLGAAATRNHHHFGAAGLYSRVPAESGCVGFAVSSCRPHFRPGETSILDAGMAAPMSFAFPAGQEPPLVLDMATRFLPNTSEIVERFPGAVFKGLGLGATCTGLGLVLAGVEELHRARTDLWPAANQGAFVLALDVERFLPRETFQRDLDGFIQLCRQLQPAPGYDRADLPGNLEWEREREWRSAGIPLSAEHRQALTRTAADTGLQVPWPPS